MGIGFAKALKKLFSTSQDFRVLMLGLDSAGKTTVLYRLKLGDIVTTIPTIGFNVETVEYKNLNFTVWDVGGQEKIRPLWSYYYKNTNALIYVVDSSDTERIHESSEEMAKLLNEEQLKGIPVLILANKQDLPKAATVSQITEKFGLHTIKSRKWYVQGCIATNGEGLIEGFDWLSKTVA